MRENTCQGGSYGWQYPKNGDNFLVIILRPDLIAPGPFIVRTYGGDPASPVGD